MITALAGMSDMRNANFTSSGFVPLAVSALRINALCLRVFLIKLSVIEFALLR